MIGEFDLIRRIQKNANLLCSKDPAVLLGIGDDSAATLSSRGNALLTTTDMLLEKTHFDFAFSSFFQIGYKALSVNLSDIAAMGGTPRFYLVSLGLTGKESVRDIDALYRGMNEASHELSISLQSPCHLIGGNTARSHAGLSISITLLGEVPKKEMVTRSTATPGDFIYVTGTLGDASAGLELLKKNLRKGGFRALPHKHLMPKARVQEGRLLAKKKIPSAMIDLSDGLSSDLLHITDQSGVGAQLACATFPISETLKRYAKTMGTNWYDYALHGGEEYELLFCVPEKNRDRLEKLIHHKAIDARCIGKILPKKHGVLVTGIDGDVYKLKPSGYDHFRQGMI